MKQITICDKVYDIDCNAFTRFQYKTVFGKGIFADIKVLNDFSEKQEKIKKELEEKGISHEEIEKQINSNMIEELDSLIDVVEKIAYILIYTANPKMESFDKWLSGIKKISLKDDWISEVTEIAVNSFC